MEIAEHLEAIKKAIDDARAAGFRVMVDCGYDAGYLEIDSPGIPESTLTITEI